MVQAGGTTYYLAYTISDNTTTSLNLNVADASLTQAISTTEPSADTFKWQVDGGGWTTSVALLGNNAAQPLINGISITFAEYSGHTLGDMWTVTVMTPATLSIGLGAALIWDNVGGALVLLSGNSIVAGVPATLVWAAGVAGWVLNNPSLPVLSSLPRKIYRRELVGDYTLSINDSGNELSYIGLGGNTLTLCPAITASGDVFDFYNAGPGLWTITAAGSDTIIIPGFPAGVSSIILGGTNPWYGCRLVTNGANWHVLATTVKTSGGSQVVTNAGTWVCPSGVTTAYVTGCGGGGGGGGGLTGGSGGGAGQQAVKIPITVVPGTTYTATVGAAGTGGAGDGVAGGGTKISHWRNDFN